MSGLGHEVAGAAPAGPRPRTPGSGLDDALVVDALARLAAAPSRADACEAVLPLLLELPGVRASAAVVRDGDRAVVVGSSGYGCGPMSAGAELPLDAGLPVTEAVRTGRTVVQGAGPSWVAVPFAGRTGALLLSLTTAPPWSPVELVRLQRVARALGDVLPRAAAQERAAADLAVVAGRLGAPVPAAGVTVRVLPHGGEVGGDVALCLPDGRGGRWLVVADVCGSGLPAAVVARSVQAAVTAVAPHVEGPDALLAAVDRALRGSAGAFVTAAVVHETGGRAQVASAGHPAPLLLTPAGPRAVEVEPGLPLALEGGPAGAWPVGELRSAPGEVLLLHTDGLTDRRTAAGPVCVDVASLVAGARLDDLEALADHALAAAQDAGAQGDDVTLLLARPLA